MSDYKCGKMGCTLLVYGNTDYCAKHLEDFKSVKDTCTHGFTSEQKCEGCDTEFGKEFNPRVVRCAQCGGGCDLCERAAIILQRSDGRIDYICSLVCYGTYHAHDIAQGNDVGAELQTFPQSYNGG